MRVYIGWNENQSLSHTCCTFSQLYGLSWNSRTLVITTYCTLGIDELYYSKTYIATVLTAQVGNYLLFYCVCDLRLSRVAYTVLYVVGERFLSLLKPNSDLSNSGRVLNMTWIGFHRVHQGPAAVPMKALPMELRNLQQLQAVLRKQRKTLSYEQKPYCVRYIMPKIQHNDTPCQNSMLCSSYWQGRIQDFRKEGHAQAEWRKFEN